MSAVLLPRPDAERNLALPRDAGPFSTITPLTLPGAEGEQTGTLLMHAFSDERIRASFVNASLRERKALVLPADLGETPWQDLDYFGWRDPKLPLLGYVVAEVDDEPVAVLLRQAQRTPRGRVQCSWCEDVQLPSPVTFFGAKRAGDAGRSGNTVGTLVCANFECSANVRRRPTLAYVGFDLEAERRRRMEALRTNVTNFVRNVRDGA